MGNQSDNLTNPAENGEDKENAKKSATVRVLVSAIVVMALWGSIYPFIQLGYSYLGLDKSNVFDLLLFAGARFLVSGAVLSAFCFARKKTQGLKSGKTLGFLALFALFSVVLHYSFTYISLAHIESGKTALLKQSCVLVFVCFSFLFIREDKFSWQKIVGAVLGIASIVIVNMEAFRFSFSLGALLVVAASLCTVVYNVIFKKRLSVDPLAATGLAQFAGGALLTLAGVCGGGAFRTFSPNAAAVCAYIIVATIVSYGLWFYILGKYDLSRLFIVKMSEPLFAALFAFVLPVGGTLKIEHLIAFALIAAAVVVSNVKFTKKPKKEKEIL